VRPAFRGLGLGRALMEWVMERGPNRRLPEIVGDTMPVMRDALALYDRMGFERIGVAAAGPGIFLAAHLRRADPDPHQALALCNRTFFTSSPSLPRESLFAIQK
jgi:GNAT superfamily N-acetyltransferase